MAKRTDGTRIAEVMKKLITPMHYSRAFTLIEMLVVIAIIGILASLLLVITPGISKTKKLKVARTELAQVETAIETYKSKLGFYPPDNPKSIFSPNGFITNQLYFELLGTVATNGSYITRDGSAQISPSDMLALFGVNGFANSSGTAKSTDESVAATSFIKNLRPNQIGSLNGQTNILLVCSIPWSDDLNNQLLTSPTTGLNPWRYNSSHPTNNPNSFDLWVDIIINGKTNRISNWSKDAQIVP
jgi:prepilin-type N-terminal cleavage/methylation domain-containing protein